jgi:hypothetical protein
VMGWDGLWCQSWCFVMSHDGSRCLLMARAGFWCLVMDWDGLWCQSWCLTMAHDVF